MGRALIQLAHNNKLALIGGIEAANSAHLGSDLGQLAGLPPLGIKVSTDLHLIGKADVVIDFSCPEASVQLATHAAKSSTPLVIGTTGFNAAQEAQLHEAAHHSAIVKAGNMSLGVSVLATLVARAATLLDADWDIEISEMHHRDKKDAPSGTALLLGAAAAQARGIDVPTAATIKDHIQQSKETKTRQRGTIGFAVARGGDVIGTHEVVFAGLGERIRLSHMADDRAIFAQGALHAAQWLLANQKPPALYTMSDVVGAL